jgi:hypothetical protein
LPHHKPRVSWKSALDTTRRGIILFVPRRGIKKNIDNIICRTIEPAD